MNSCSYSSHPTTCHGRPRSCHRHCTPNSSCRRKCNTHTQRAWHLCQRYARIPWLHRPIHRHQYHSLPYLRLSTSLHSRRPNRCSRTSGCIHRRKHHLQQWTGRHSIWNSNLARLIWLGDWWYNHTCNPDCAAFAVCF